MTAIAGHRLRRNSIYSVLGVAVPGLLLLAATPFLVHRMGSTNYGLWSISLAALGLFSAVEFGLGTALAKFIAEFVGSSDVGALAGVATTAVIVYAALAAAFTVPMFLLAHSIAGLFVDPDMPQARVAGVIRLVALGLPALLLKSASLAVAIGLQRFVVPMVAALVQNGLTISLAVVVVLAGGSLHMVVLSSLLSLVLAACGSLAVALRYLARLGVRPRLARGSARKLLSYVAFTGLSGIGTLVFESLDRLLVGIVLDLRAVTYYVVSIGVANKLLYISDVATRPLMPASSEAAASGRAAHVRGLLRLATIRTAMFSSVAAIVVLVVSGPFMRAWIGSSFAAHALGTFRILVVVYAIVAMGAPAYHIANGIGLAWLGAATALVGGAVTLLLIAVLGHAYGLVGAASANFAYCITLVTPLILVRTLRRQIAADGAPGGGGVTRTAS